MKAPVQDQIVEVLKGIEYHGGGVGAGYLPPPSFRPLFSSGWVAGMDGITGAVGFLFLPEPPPRPLPTGSSKSGLLPSSKSCRLCLSCLTSASGDRHFGFTPRWDMEVKWLVSLAAGECAPSGISSRDELGCSSPRAPGVSAGGKSLGSAKRGSTSS